MQANRRWKSLAILVASLGLAAGCATNPVTGRSEISLVTPDQELQMGREGYTAVVQEYGLYDDPAFQAYVNEVGQRIAKVSDLPNLEWHFTIVDDPSVNAFAMPGGYIYVTRGILPYLNSEAQLAGVLGHEIGHVTHRHTAQQITQEQLYGLGLGIGALLSPTLRQYSGAAQQALGLLFLKYSRTHETEADELGVRYSTAAGYDSREMPRTFVMLGRISDQSGGRLPGFLETHPDPGDRANVTAALAQKAVAGKTGLIIRHDEYIRHVDSIVFGADPRQGYFEGDRYYNPELRFQMLLPTGWKQQDTHNSLAAAEPNQAAVMQVTLASDAGDLSPSAYVQQLVGNASFTTVDGGPETIGGHAAWVGHIDVPQQNAAATRLVAAFLRKDTSMFQMLGQSRTPGDANEGRIVASFRSFGDLSDPSRLNVSPTRLRVAAAASAGSFASVVASLGGAAADAETNAIMNDAQSGDPVSAGRLIKYVARGR